VIFVNGATGKYLLDITGTGNGPYHIKVKRTLNDEVFEYWINGTIHTDDTKISEIIVTQSDWQEEVGFYNQVWFWIVICLIVLISTPVLIQRRRMKREWDMHGNEEQT
jgi:hypothetical protein